MTWVLDHHFAPVVGRMVVSTAVQSGRRRVRNTGWARVWFFGKIAHTFYTHFDAHIFWMLRTIFTKEAWAGWGHSTALLHLLFLCTFALLHRIYFCVFLLHCIVCIFASLHRIYFCFIASYLCNLALLHFCLVLYCFIALVTFTFTFHFSISNIVKCFLYISQCDQDPGGW